MKPLALVPDDARLLPWYRLLDEAETRRLAILISDVTSEFITPNAPSDKLVESVQKTLGLMRGAGHKMDGKAISASRIRLKVMVMRRMPREDLESEVKRLSHEFAVATTAATTEDALRDQVSGTLERMPAAARAEMRTIFLQQRAPSLEVVSA